MNDHMAFARRSGVALTSLALAGALLLTFANPAGAASVPKVLMGTAANYSVLAGTGVTNTGNTTMHMNLGTSPTPAIVGFPPGQVIVPGVVDQGNAPQAQLDLTAAYDNAHLRGGTITTTANLAGKTLQGGVYAGPSKAPLLLPVGATLTLDGANNPNTVFIFQTDSSLTTETGSRVSLIKGAQECNVFWQVLSSADLGTGSTFVGNIFALTSIVIRGNVTVHGRALARNGSVTMINDHFTNPTCATSLPPGAPGPTTTVAGGVTTSTAVGTPTTSPGGTTTTTLGLTVGIAGPPRTGVAPLPTRPFPWPVVLLVSVAGAATTAAVVRRRRTANGTTPVGH